MRAVFSERSGGTDVLRVSQIPASQPRAGEQTIDGEGVDRARRGKNMPALSTPLFHPPRLVPGNRGVFSVNLRDMNDGARAHRGTRERRQDGPRA